MERICPFLSLEDDGRTAVAGYDPRHRCGAVRPTDALDRPQQLSTCLVIDHRSCPRYVAALEALRVQDAWATPAVDAGLVSTRLVLGPEAAARGVRGAYRQRRSAARWGIAAAAAVAGVAAVGSLSGAFTGSQGRPSVPPSNVALAASPSVTQGPAVGAPSPRPSAGTPLPFPSEAATPRPTRHATPAPTALPTTAPQARTYVVQPGDTLAAIAVRFGSSVSALQAANDLADTDVILVGQVLVIP